MHAVSSLTLTLQLPTPNSSEIYHKIDYEQFIRYDETPTLTLVCLFKMWAVVCPLLILSLKILNIAAQIASAQDC